MYGAGFKPNYSFITGKKGSQRKPFKVSTKKIEWNAAAGREPYDFKSTSKCRKCGTKLIWKGGGYDFDHWDNNPARNTQRNCRLVCKTCHGKHTKFGTRKTKDMFGNTIGSKRIKKKLGYKKATRPKLRKGKRKRRSSGYGLLGYNFPKLY